MICNLHGFVALDWYGVVVIIVNSVAAQQNAGSGMERGGGAYTSQNLDNFRTDTRNPCEPIGVLPPAPANGLWKMRVELRTDTQNPCEPIGVSLLAGATDP